MRRWLRKVRKLTERANQEAVEVWTDDPAAKCSMERVPEEWKPAEAPVYCRDEVALAA